MLTLQEVIRELNMSEFARLCFEVDRVYGRRTQFDINYISMVKDKKVIQIDAGDGRVMKVTLL